MSHASRTCLLVLAGLAASTAHAQTTGKTRPSRSAEEEKRRKILQEIGLDKQAGSTAPPSGEKTTSAEPPSPADETAAGSGARQSPPSAKGKTAAPAPPSFRRAIHPMLMTTCGACHRAGGPAAATRLLLTGDAGVDHAVVARLVSVGEPAASALLVKVSGATHAGGSPWPAQSAPYARLMAWVGAGARLDRAVAEPVAAAPAPAEAAVPPTVHKTAPVAVKETAPVAAAPTPELASPPSVPTPGAATELAGPEFSRDVHPLLMNACAACHRAPGPAAMTRLTLTGIPANDEPTVRALVAAVAPDESALLRKASGALHGGGAIFSATGTQYQTIRAWVASIAPSGAEPPGPAGSAGAVNAAVSPVAAASAPPAVPAPHPGHGAHPGGLALPLGFMLNGRFDLDYERRQFSGDPFASGAVDALRSYHHFLFLSRNQPDEPCGLSVEILTLQFWEAHCRLTGRRRPVRVEIEGGKIVVPFGADPLYHQSYGGLAGFDQRILPVIWAVEGAAARLVHDRGALVFTDDLFVVRGYALGKADGVLNLQNDFSPVDDARIGWGNRLGAAWMGVSAWYSAYFNPLGFGRHLFMQAIDLTVWRQRAVPVLGHFSFGAGALRADVAGGDATGVGGVGKDYYHFGSYLQVRYHPTDWLYIQYRQGLRTFDNRRGVVLDNSRLTSADGSTHNFGVVARHHGLTAGIYYFINLEKVDEIPDDLLRVSVAYEF